MKFVVGKVLQAQGKIFNTSSALNWSCTPEGV